MVEPAIEIDSAQTTTTSSFGVPLSTTSNRDGRITRWDTRDNDNDNNMERRYPSWKRLSIVMLSLYLCILIVSLVSYFLCVLLHPFHVLLTLLSHPSHSSHILQTITSNAPSTLAQLKLFSLLQ